ncbi:hypothetical protein LEP1GSC089_2204 [Leptospira interrogans serovar Autumnalis str. LP101]|nr:hypothetical protein LEP1GSC089_2204 [Leptospira interrogans serovar Autumnalis str. LP101]
MGFIQFPLYKFKNNSLFNMICGQQADFPITKTWNTKWLFLSTSVLCSAISNFPQVEFSATWSDTNDDKRL